jgi:pyrimidine-nucleoside phosphorylase
MDQPLGRAVGNALEIREAVATLRGEGPPDFAELVLAASAHMLELSDLGLDVAEGRRLAEEAIGSGSALACYERWVRAQGGDPAEDALPEAPAVVPIDAPRAGLIRGLNALGIGLAALHLGAGRRTKHDAIDHSVGVVCLRKRGDAVSKGEPLAEVHARDRGAADAAAAEVLAAYEIGDDAPPSSPVVLETLA